MNLVSKLRTVLDSIDKEFQFKENLVLTAVLIPIFIIDEKILMTKRSNLVKFHKRQIAFPGGRYDDQDQDLITTALRETYEEVGIKPGQVEVIGKLNPLETINNHYVHPYVGIISEDIEIIINPDEVAEYFFVPITKLLDKSTAKKGFIAGGVRLYYSVEKYKIWGITAGILSDLLTRLKSF
ncbi:MAG: CoA pyrophosphatase [Candidatus Heimdallarchaeota archaeon]|nr:CoA pyrophosphatase [Candidatus Heimdallarchaeota archaeon]MCK4254999.1 CoA pyrophosphatase [Candidatus Heimdallarchaeota archaeon]